MFGRLLLRRAYATRTWSKAIREAFNPELTTADMHCTLLNQTSPSQLLALTDVKPMMGIYNHLVAQSSSHTAELSPAQLIVRKVSKALHQTAKDSSLALRSLPLSVRAPQQQILFDKLTSALEVVSESIVANRVSADEATLTQLFSAYEIVNPLAGTAFYRELVSAYNEGKLTLNDQPQRLDGIGAVIQCMLKSDTPIEEIVGVVQTECGGDLSVAPRWTLANLALALLKHHKVTNAQHIFNLLMSEREILPPKLESFLLDAFIGDAPFSIALDVFIEYPDHVPHHSAMTRMLERAFLSEVNIEDQISLFSSYLSRLALPSEFEIKTVSSTVVASVLNANSQQQPEDIIPAIEEICAVYEQKMREHTVLLNILLTEISSRWPQVDEARKLVLAVLKNYGPEDDQNVVSIRVRLNALSALSDAGGMIEELWESRTSLGMPPLIKLDWLALVRACRGSYQFRTKWDAAGRPFESDVRRFSRARGFKP